MNFIIAFLVSSSNKITRPKRKNQGTTCLPSRHFNFAILICIEILYYGIKTKKRQIGWGPGGGSKCMKNCILVVKNFWSKNLGLKNFGASFGDRKSSNSMEFSFSGVRESFQKAYLLENTFNFSSYLAL